VTVEARFADVVTEFALLPGVTPPGVTKGFGRSALRYNGKIFAMLVRGRLVVKLPQARVDTEVASGHGDRFDANKGTPMKEWLAVDPAAKVDWAVIVREALVYAGG
jgi:hypothetical protein